MATMLGVALSNRASVKALTRFKCLDLSEASCVDSSRNLYIRR